MNQQVRELWRVCVLEHTQDPMNWQVVADRFAELLLEEFRNTLARSAQSLPLVVMGHMLYLDQQIVEHFYKDEKTF